MHPQTPTLDFDDVNDAFIATPSPSLQSPPPVTNNARKSRLPFLDKATNNRNNGNPKMVANGGVYDPLLPSNNGVTQYGVAARAVQLFALLLKRFRPCTRVTAIVIVKIVNHHYAVELLCTPV